MFSKIFVEKGVFSHPRVEHIVNFFQQKPVMIDKVEKIFGRVKKPYLDKRSDLNLFIGEKKGQLLKLAPPSYGMSQQENTEHFYFIHAYNCIYECEYCYLQGYFSSPDLVFFINHEEILLEMERKITQYPDKKLVFHGGEFSDSLAFSHITNELPVYWDFFKKHPQAVLELRSKSNNLKAILALESLPNVVISFSLSPENAIKRYEHKTPSLKSRLLAMKKLHEKGFSLAVHFDPIFYHSEVKSEYRDLIKELKISLGDLNFLRYLSLGVVRFPKNIFKQVKMNYPASAWLNEDFKFSQGDKVKYVKPQRKWLLNSVFKELIQSELAPQKIYFCMES